MRQYHKEYSEALQPPLIHICQLSEQEWETKAAEEDWKNSKGVYSLGHKKRKESPHKQNGVPVCCNMETWHFREPYRDLQSVCLIQRNSIIPCWYFIIQLIMLILPWKYLKNFMFQARAFCQYFQQSQFHEPLWSLLLASLEKTNSLDLGRCFKRKWTICLFLFVSQGDLSTWP